MLFGVNNCVNNFGECKDDNIFLFILFFQVQNGYFNVFYKNFFVVGLEVIVSDDV